MSDSWLPPCPRCKGEKFFSIPDSLASACEVCGFVWVGIGSNVTPGATLGQWMEDVYKIPNTLDTPWKDGDCER